MFCVLLVTASGFAQAPSNITVQVNVEQTRQLKDAWKSLQQVLSGQKCAVPLLQADSTKGAEPKVKQVTPDASKTAPMPEYKGLPPCGAK